MLDLLLSSIRLARGSSEPGTRAQSKGVHCKTACKTFQVWLRLRGSLHEGSPYAVAINAAGYNAFVL